MNNQDMLLMREAHIIKKILYAYSNNELHTVRHFMTDDLYKKLIHDIENDRKLGQKVCIEEVHVELQVNREFDDSDKHYIETICNCKNLKYVLKDNKVIGGSNEKRSLYSTKVLLVKDKDAPERTFITCEGCGTSFDLKNTGYCPTCGKKYKYEKYDYVIKEMEI